MTGVILPVGRNSTAPTGHHVALSHAAVRYPSNLHRIARPFSSWPARSPDSLVRGIGASNMRKYHHHHHSPQKISTIPSSARPWWIGANQGGWADATKNCSTLRASTPQISSEVTLCCL
ncbi:hypothetical protein CSOJ01_07016 [Colletotrichum sojae]|uniref:Uncharacterized protein n=1 Tax=Colletotrichum sojae TaxID=2175907 RepID=A0A8H6JAB9_9PEZI|nr:hypothetical protein CSOJ01_07016 [Colletotrichum sojae]